MASKYIILLALGACVLAAQAAPPAAAKPPGVSFIPKNIVANVTKDCPVKNVLFTKAEFDVDKVMDLANTMQEKGVSQKCQDEAVADLASCAMDDSMAVKQGCCSIDCSTGIKKSIASGCFDEYADAICNDPASQNMMTGLLNAGVRCANFTTTCADILKKVPKNATAGANTTKATPAAAAPAGAAAPAPTKSAAAQAVAAVMPLAAAAAAFLLL
jgi:hypothetical protein